MDRADLGRVYYLYARRKDLAKFSLPVEAALMGALKSLPAWPNIFKAYMRPMKPLDGRLILPIALAQYLFKHPEGKNEPRSF